MAKLRPPKVAGKPVPFFSSVELSKVGRCCRGNSFEDRRDAAVLTVFLATGIRVSELAAIRYCAGDPDRGDVDLEARQIRVRGKGGRDRTVKISHEAARRAAAARWTAAGSISWWCAGARSAGCGCTRTGSGTISATRGWTVAGPRGT
jgi:site-specific recombinase XerD